MEPYIYILKQVHNFPSALGWMENDLKSCAFPKGADAADLDVLHRKTPQVRVSWDYSHQRPAWLRCFCRMQMKYRWLVNNAHDLEVPHNSKFTWLLLLWQHMNIAYSSAGMRQISQTMRIFSNTQYNQAASPHSTKQGSSKFVLQAESWDGFILLHQCNHKPGNVKTSSVFHSKAAHRSALVHCLRWRWDNDRSRKACLSHGSIHSTRQTSVKVWWHQPRGCRSMSASAGWRLHNWLSDFRAWKFKKLLWAVSGRSPTNHHRKLHAVCVVLKRENLTKQDKNFMRVGLSEQWVVTKLPAGQTSSLKHDRKSSAHMNRWTSAQHSVRTLRSHLWPKHITTGVWTVFSKNSFESVK